MSSIVYVVYSTDGDILGVYNTFGDADTAANNENDPEFPMYHVRQFQVK